VRKVLLFSILLVLGVFGSQILPGLLGSSYPAFAGAVRLLTMLCLAFIMIHVGYEFEIERSNLRSYAVDYGVAATAAAFPWIFCAVYFVAVLSPPGSWSSYDAWTEALLAGRFAAPTSAGILFSMLAAAGLSATWLFRKARVLAIFDDLDTVLLMIPLKALLVGLRWQLGVIVVLMVVLLWLAWRYLHRLRIPVSWPFVLLYGAGIVALSEAIYQTSKLVDEVVPVHIEVLLPAFVLGCMLARPEGDDPHADDEREGHQEGPSSPGEQRAATLVSALFMVLVGLSMPSLSLAELGGLDVFLLHVVAITVLANLGKTFPLLVYRDEASWRERLALCIALWPRGEVGAGVLIVSISYGIGGPMIAVAAASLALNLVCTGLFILAVRRLLSARHS
jgi:Kef-type K+ transport system membrane component KefB